MGNQLTESLASAIKDGSFPDSEEILSSQITNTITSDLLKSISRTRESLNEDVKGISRQEAGGVDGWIAQAKKIQEDIAKCKSEALQIVQDHAKVEALRSAAQEAKDKTSLLENEIAFNQNLVQEIQYIAQASQSFLRCEENINQDDYLSASTEISTAHNITNKVATLQTRTLLSSTLADLQRSLVNKLEQELDERLVLRKQAQVVLFEIKDGNISHLSDHAQKDGLLAKQNTFDNVLHAFENIGMLQQAKNITQRKVESAILPAFISKSNMKVSNIISEESSLSMTLSDVPTQPSIVIGVFLKLSQFLRTYIPSRICSDVVDAIISKLSPIIVSDWLNPAIPTDLSKLPELNALQKTASDAAQQLNSWQIPGGKDFEAWIEQVPRSWLAKRRISSLDSVREAFTLATGMMRQVERVEKQSVMMEKSKEKQTSKDEDDDWNENWDDDNDDDDTKESAAKEMSTQETKDDDTDAWGFDEDEKSQDQSPDDEPKDQDDESDAWGWGDGDDGATEEDKPSRSPTKSKAEARVNGVAKTPAVPDEEAQELTLAEHYSITDVPDHILELIGKDVQDASELKTLNNDILPFSAASSILDIPTLALAMFRAVAPTYYFLPPLSLSHMHLYNDCLYLSSKLSEPYLQSQLNLTNETATLVKLARTSYTSTLATHRQILSDLLDGAQGFSHCTRPPFDSACSEAVASVTAHIRSLHSTWQPILSPSHLAQAIGSLIASSIIGKMISDVEDMEDISEPESKRLHQFCEEVNTLSDLFVRAQDPTANLNPAGSTEGETLSTIALYVPNWLRFQYLQQILDSSLVDIKYLWTDAGLSLEFTRDEVVDLIKALFSDSSHRRSAIAAIQ